MVIILITITLIIVIVIALITITIIIELILTVTITIIVNCREVGTHSSFPQVHVYLGSFPVGLNSNCIPS